MAVANTLAYYNMATITAGNSFIVPGLIAQTTKQGAYHSSPIRGSTLVGSSVACKFQTRVEVNGSSKHSSLLQSGNNYGRKKYL
jgi:hypothetical protein